MAHILYDSNLLAALRQEINPAITDSSPGLEYRLEQCPRLKAVYYEVLRLAVSSATIRGIQSTVEIGGKILQSGVNILIFYRQLHHNPNVFGADSERFDPERFLQNKSLAKNPSFRPFGGGKTYCPGRHLAEKKILTFVALTIHRFDIDVVKKESRGTVPSHGKIAPGFPRLDTRKFCLGIIAPLEGDDLVLEVRRRLT